MMGCPTGTTVPDFSWTILGLWALAALAPCPKTVNFQSCLSYSTVMLLRDASSVEISLRKSIHCLEEAARSALETCAREASAMFLVHI